MDNTHFRMYIIHTILYLLYKDVKNEKYRVACFAQTLFPPGNFARAGTVKNHLNLFFRFMSAQTDRYKADNICPFGEAGRRGRRAR